MSYKQSMKLYSKTQVALSLFPARTPSFRVHGGQPLQCAVEQKWPQRMASWATSSQPTELPYQQGVRWWSGGVQELERGGRTTWVWLRHFPKPGSVAAAWTISVVRQGRVPVHVHNLQDFPVSLGRYMKLGRLFQVDEGDVHGT